MWANGKWNREPSNKPIQLRQLIFNNGAIWENMNSLFNKWRLDNWIYTCTRIQLDSYHTSYTKTNSKWLKINETIKLTEENTGINPHVP